MVYHSQTEDIKEFDISPIEESSENSPTNLKGYYVNSTAPINIEDIPIFAKNSVKAKIREIALYLLEDHQPQVIISIHGYSNQLSFVKERSKEIYQYASSICQSGNNVFLGYRWPAENPWKDDPEAEGSQPTTFREKLLYAFQSLPTMLVGIFISMVVLSIVTILMLIGHPFSSTALLIFGLIVVFPFLVTKILLNLTNTSRLLPQLPIWMFFSGLGLGVIATMLKVFHFNILLVFFLVCFIAVSATLVTLIILRLSTYLRDSYRASHYGVLDLVNLIQYLDKYIFEARLLEHIDNNDPNLTDDILQEMNIKTREEWLSKNLAERMELWDQIEINIQQKIKIEQEKEKEIAEKIKNKVKLSFIGHSMGCFVVTDVIRILSDVFDPNAINKNITSEIGHSFCLCRLVLVAPDIPVESIMSGRANFLSHSLRRCKEAYVFSNEGDLALRLASTAANYFSFPAKTRFSGYKLGNLTAKRFTNKYDESNKLLTKQEYGIINLQEGKIHSPYQYLEIRASNLEHRNLCELEFGKVCETIPYSTDEERLDQKDIRLSDLFTYFDCTDYIDVKNGSELADLQNSTKLVGIVSYALKKSDLNFPDYFRLGFAYFIDSGAKNINTHGGYFDGNFSQKAIYEIAFLGFKGFLLSYLSNSQLQLRDNKEFEQISREQREKILDALSKDCQSKGIQVVLSPKCYEETVGT